MQEFTSSILTEEVELPPFEKTNTLLSRNTPPSHKISQLSKPQKNIQLIFIVLSKQQPIHTKTNILTQCLVSDETASMFINFYNNTGILMHEGDIVYVSGVYSTFYKEMLLLYQGSQSIVKRVGRQFFRFNSQKNMSLESLKKQGNETANYNKQY